MKKILKSEILQRQMLLMRIEALLNEFLRQRLLYCNSFKICLYPQCGWKEQSHSTSPSALGFNINLGRIQSIMTSNLVDQKHLKSWNVLLSIFEQIVMPYLIKSELFHFDLTSISSQQSESSGTASSYCLTFSLFSVYKV